MKFEGFSQDAVKFFRGLRKNNSREWFQPRKEIFDLKVRAVMEELIGLINVDLGRFAPLHIAEPKKAIYRLYRDTRFSSDKTPYKTNIAANFPRLGMEKHSAAGFYFSVSDDQIEVAGGLYMPGPAELLAIRTHIADQHERFGKIVRSKKVVEMLGPLTGTSLTRVPKGFDAAHPGAEWIRMKQWMFYKTLPSEWMTKPALYPTVAQAFQLVSPLIEFLNEPLVRAAKKPSAERMLH